MIFIIPTRTDAPIYHWPWVTLVVIAANAVTFWLTGYGHPANLAAWEPWALEFGTGLHPLEWVSCHFVHFGWLHLLGNMIFLWGFGLVVEGKIGWKWYLLVYFGIGIAGAMLLQIAMLWAEPRYSGGASLVIFGLLAMSLVWAPKNEVTVLLFILYRGFVFDVTILTFCLYYIGIEVLVAALHAFSMSSAMLHLTGAALGFGLGVFMLKRNLVDCENWDLFAVLKGTYGNRQELEAPFPLDGGRSSRPAHERTAEPESPPHDEPPAELEEVLVRRSAQQRRTLRKMRALLRAGKPRAALQEYQRLKHVLTTWPLDAADLQALIHGLYKAQAWAEVVPLMQEFVQRFPAQATAIKLKLAGVALEVQQRPRFALKLLADIPEETLSRRLIVYYRRMHRLARKMIDEGVIELDGQAW